MTYQVTPPAAAAGTSETAAPAAPPPEETKISVSRGLASWLTQNQTSFAITSYQSGRLFLVGTMPDGTVSVHQSAFSRAMGVCWDRNGLWLASRVQIWRLENILPEGMVAQGTFDLSLMPRQTFITGDIDVHEMGVGRRGAAGLREHELFLPCHDRSGAQLPSDLEAQLHLRAGARGPLPHERPRHARRQAEICDGRQPDRRRRRLARPSASEGRRHRRRDESRRNGPAFDAALAPRSAGREAICCRQRSWIPRRGRQGDRRPSGTWHSAPGSFAGSP